VRVRCTPILYPVGDIFGGSGFHCNSVPFQGQFLCECVPHQIRTRLETDLVVLPSTPNLYPCGDSFGATAFHTNSVPGRRQFWWYTVPH